MALSMKHYREAALSIADAVSRANGNKVAKATAYTIADRLAFMFKSDNRAFDRDKFMDACGFGDNDDI